MYFNTWYTQLVAPVWDVARCLRSEEWLGEVGYHEQTLKGEQYCFLHLKSWFLLTAHFYTASTQRVINVSSPCREGLAHIHWQCWLLHFGGSGKGLHGSDLFWISFNATSGTQSKANSHPLFLAHAVPAFSVVERSLMSLMLSASGRPCLCLPCIFFYKPLMVIKELSLAVLP